MSRFSPEFYSTAAQVIPVLLVVVFVEILLPEDRRRLLNYEDGAPFLLAALCLAVAGEITCLIALDQRKPPSEWGRSLVFGGLLFPALLLVIAVAAPILTSITKTMTGFILINAYFLGITVTLALATANVITFTTFLAVGCWVLIGAVVALSLLARINDVRTRVRSGGPPGTD